MQLDVGKLFCACQEEGSPTEITFMRKLHSLTGESGTTDISTMYEDSKDQTFRYSVTTNSCLVEADEEPPHSPNEKAVEIALAVSMALKASLLQDITVMRKVVIDGSNTGGFQRTAIVSMGGEIASEDCKANIIALSLEEDSCRRIGEKNGIIDFSLDRLGIPLIEIATEPDMRTPEEAISIARAIGNLTLVPGYLRKGADAIRQDVNFSMGYGRVEIKGVSKLNFIRDVLEKEVERQSKLFEAMNIIRERGGFHRIMFDNITERMKFTGSKILSSGIEQGKSVL
jgi:Archaeal Glu-tRNAGln amidotransferase subunit E (contains GAD domain)